MPHAPPPPFSAAAASAAAAPADGAPDYQAKHWCCTIYPDSYPSQDRYESDLNKLERAVEWAVLGNETCPTTQRCHVQGYCIFVKKVRLATLKKTYHTTIHWERAKGSPSQNWEYCTKEDKNPTEFGEKPEFKDNGEREKARWGENLQLARQGQFDTMDPQILLTHYRNVKAIRADAVNTGNNLEATCGVWMYGVAGSGKSHYAREFYSAANGWRIYLKGCNKWFDGYEDEEVVLMDDISPCEDGHDHPLRHHIKLWTDKYPFAAEVKGGCFRSIRPKVVVFTSNYKWDEVFLNPKDHDAFKRRFKVIHFPYQYGDPRHTQVVVGMPVDDVLDVSDSSVFVTPKYPRASTACPDAPIARPPTPATELLRTDTVRHVPRMKKVRVINLSQDEDDE